jgi:hypothetical protein
MAAAVPGKSDLTYAACAQFVELLVGVSQKCTSIGGTSAFTAMM